MLSPPQNLIYGLLPNIRKGCVLGARTDAPIWQSITDALMHGATAWRYCACFRVNTGRLVLFPCRGAERGSETQRCRV